MGEKTDEILARLACFKVAFYIFSLGHVLYQRYCTAIVVLCDRQGTNECGLKNLLFVVPRSELVCEHILTIDIDTWYSSTFLEQNQTLQRYLYVYVLTRPWFARNP